MKPAFHLLESADQTPWKDSLSSSDKLPTRSPLARADFDLFKSFGPRLLFGMSLPTLRNDLSKIYEPKAPAPSQRIATLRAAHEAGLNVYVAVAPTYPECDEADLRATLRAVAEVKPVTIFHEPINIRAENVERIQSHADKLGVELKTDVFESRERWQDYAVNALQTAERVAAEVGVADQLHLWPDKSLGNLGVASRMPKPRDYMRWLRKSWSRVSEWPT